MATDKNWVTAADVARHAGVSRSAVSRTFTAGASVSDKTRQRVLAAASELGYQVNIIARTMITGSSNFVGIVTAGFDNPFRSKLLAPLVHHLALQGFMPLLMNADDPQQLEPSLRQLLSYHVAGVILTSGAPPLSLAEEYLAKKIPVTLINRHAELPGADRVASDNAQGAQLAAAHLRSQGAKNIAFIGENATNFSTQQRYKAFCAAQPEQQIVAFFCATAGYQAGRNAAEELLRNHPLLDAFFCATDMLAMGVIDYLREQQIPSGQIKVMGFDDIPQAAYGAYQLTTLAQDTDLLASHAVDLLIKRIQNFARPGVQMAIPVQLIIRQSA
ncbi:LacI family DNA-binding transcriptional regulator [Erwiniaceae bacterium BAC15a-03b]|uniref:LacI family DNA-binding transcriptional regulator n=1 Tax=Winslowiella arboricola TaxID=2978220 RepID=A0A9J6PK11_9GAMM|nr:LacI family DNA-binding transcriptional regulator [Winslowiella arboricola]MCU5772045.1 LacI family DNA-binding transcriptional regulator [Winslowiella arboricola]MCU5776117.1 LacI family DNA-binding transcriptional regulator [Winslowiella arboricola]